MKKYLISKIDDVLTKHQFHRNGPLWNRKYDNVVDVVDLQISKSRETFTINAGVADRLIVHVCWGVDGSDMVEEPLCTVRARLGELLHGRDVWWNLSNENSIEEVLKGIQDVVIPFLQLNHSVDHMIECLENDPASRNYPPGFIYLALLYHRKGENDRCREMLKSMKLTGAWSKKITDVLNLLN